MTDIRTGNFWIKLLKKIAAIMLKNLGAAPRPATHHQHVVPHEEGWAVRGEGNERYTAVYKYQEDAIERAREIAKGYRADVIVHRQDGTIRERISYN